jgi:hypothetical protein
VAAEQLAQLLLGGREGEIADVQFLAHSLISSSPTQARGWARPASVIAPARPDASIPSLC